MHDKYLFELEKNTGETLTVSFEKDPISRSFEILELDGDLDIDVSEEEILDELLSIIEDSSNLKKGSGITNFFDNNVSYTFNTID